MLIVHTVDNTNKKSQPLIYKRNVQNSNKCIFLISSCKCKKEWPRPRQISVELDGSKLLRRGRVFEVKSSLIAAGWASVVLNTVLYLQVNILQLHNRTSSVFFYLPSYSCYSPMLALNCILAYWPTHPRYQMFWPKSTSCDRIFQLDLVRLDLHITISVNYWCLGPDDAIRCSPRNVSVIFGEYQQTLWIENQLHHWK